MGGVNGVLGGINGGLGGINGGLGGINGVLGGINGGLGGINGGYGGINGNLGTNPVDIRIVNNVIFLIQKWKTTWFLIICLNLQNGGQSCGYNLVLCCNNGIGTIGNNYLEGACGIRKIQPQPQTIPGQASFGSYPWQAAFLSVDGSYFGSGVLIDERHVLTVAHKVQNNL